MSDIERSNSMFKFKTICQRLGDPIAAEKNGRSIVIGFSSAGGASSLNF
jgi:hypothetical protein